MERRSGRAVSVMLEISNVKVYDLEESVIACRNAMRTEMPEYTPEEFEKSLVRAKKLCRASAESVDVKCHDNFLTGIRVAFDMKYTQYITKQMQRYHWFDYVSSSSMMHRLIAKPVEGACAEYVTAEAVENLERCIARYKEVDAREWREGDVEVFRLRGGASRVATCKGDALYYAFVTCVQNVPMGYELFVRVNTNYKQLRTMWCQRRGHKLREDWGAFCKFVEGLPYAEEFITGKLESKDE